MLRFTIRLAIIGSFFWLVSVGDLARGDQSMLDLLSTSGSSTATGKCTAVECPPPQGAPMTTVDEFPGPGQQATQNAGNGPSGRTLDLDADERPCARATMTGSTSGGEGIDDIYAKAKHTTGGAAPSTTATATGGLSSTRKAKYEVLGNAILNPPGIPPGFVYVLKGTVTVKATGARASASLNGPGVTVNVLSDGATQNRSGSFTNVLEHSSTQQLGSGSTATFEGEIAIVVEVGDELEWTVGAGAGTPVELSTDSFPTKAFALTGEAEARIKLTLVVVPESDIEEQTGSGGGGSSGGSGGGSSGGSGGGSSGGSGGYDSGSGGYDDGSGGYDDGSGGYDDGSDGYDDGSDGYGGP